MDTRDNLDSDRNEPRFSEEELESFVKQVERRLSRCSNAQPYEGGSPVWINPHMTLKEIMDGAEVPEECQTEVAERARCPSCAGPHDLWEEVGYKPDEELQFEELWEEWQNEHSDELNDFYLHLERFPYLGTVHRLGRRIYDSIRNFPACEIENEEWFRARRLHDGRDMSPADFFPPDPERNIVGEGRFNHFGQSVLYLARTAHGAALETMQEAETRAWVQKFRIRRLERIMDLTSQEYWAEEGVPVVAIGLIHSGVLERRVQRTKSWKPEYFIARFIADCARSQGFSGIEFKSAQHYFDNLVVFNFGPENCVAEGEPQLLRVEEIHRRQHFADEPVVIPQESFAGLLDFTAEHERKLEGHDH
jgi:hypothetical protein